MNRSQRNLIKKRVEASKGERLKVNRYSGTRNSIDSINVKPYPKLSKLAQPTLPEPKISLIQIF